MPDFDLTGELLLKTKLHMLRPITEKVHSGNGPVSWVLSEIHKKYLIWILLKKKKKKKKKHAATHTHTHTACTKYDNIF